MAVKKTAARTDDGLTLKQEEFCQLFVTESEFFGNGTQTYLEIYGYKDDKNGRKIKYETAMANASRLLSNAKIIKRIDDLLEIGGFNDENVDKQHLFLINQYADKKVKLGAIAEYNKVKGRIKQKIEHSGEVTVIEGIEYVKPDAKTKDNNKADNQAG